MQCEFACRRKSGFFRDAVDNAAAAAAAKDHRVWPFNRLDAFEIVQIAIILYVVADTVEIKVGARTVAANDHVVAIIFTLVGRHAGHISHHIRNARHQLVTNLLFLNDGHRLRHVAQRRKGFGRAYDGIRDVDGFVADGYVCCRRLDAKHNCG